MSMHYAFQDVTHLYIIMVFFSGGDLFNIIENEESLDEADMKFYMAEVVSELNDLHET